MLLGTLAQRHPAYAEICWLARELAAACGASVGHIVEGANAAGAYLAGAVPHRAAGGAAAPRAGLAASAMLEARLAAYVLLGGIDPAWDLAGATSALGAAEQVIALTSHLPATLRETVHVVLPIGTFAETSGTYVNVEGRWQSWQPVARALGDSRPGWKVLRMLGTLLGLAGFEAVRSEDIRDELAGLCGPLAAPLTVGAPASRAGARPAGGPSVAGASVPAGASAGAGGWLDIPPYQIDILVRGSDSLGKTPQGQLARAVVT